jgi:hypothetical protein
MRRGAVASCAQQGESCQRPGCGGSGPLSGVPARTCASEQPARDAVRCHVGCTATSGSWPIPPVVARKCLFIPTPPVYLCIAGSYVATRSALGRGPRSRSPGLTTRYGQRTCTPRAVLPAASLAPERPRRLTGRLACTVSRSTLLRRIYAPPNPDGRTPLMLGVELSPTLGLSPTAGAAVTGLLWWRADWRRWPCSPISASPADEASATFRRSCPFKRLADVAGEMPSPLFLLFQHLVKARVEGDALLAEGVPLRRAAPGPHWPG